MKKELTPKIVLYFIIILIMFLFFHKISKYFDTKIKYESAKCSDSAYIIYKGYDDQITEYRTTDWAQRSSKCSEIEAEYQKGL